MAVNELHIRSIGPQGDGISIGNRGTIYVDRAVPGDRVTVRTRRDDEGISRAEILTIVQPSPFRQKPPCIHYDRCGGCTLQHLNDNFYKRWKSELVREMLWKNGLQPKNWLPPAFIGAGKRRRATFAAFRNRNKVMMGFYRRRSSDITDIHSCLVADSRMLSLRDAIKPLLVPLLQEEKTVDVFLQITESAVDIVITGPVGRNGEPDAVVRDSANALLKIPNANVARVSWRLSDRTAPVILASRGPVTATFGELFVNLPPDAFLQPTLEGERALVKAVVQALPERGRYADLFSGCGTFSGSMLAKGPVDAYESELDAVKALSKAGDKKQLRVFRRDLFRHPLKRDELNRYDAVVIDPPRAGCREQAMNLSSAKTGSVISVSCNPATFARDARILCEGGYRFQSIQLFDQFHWSHHVELVGHFTKKSRRR